MARGRLAHVIAIVLLVIVASGGWLVVVRREEKRRREEGRAAQRQVASDAMMLYDAAKRDGHRVDACMYAGRAVAALERAKADSLRAVWKAVEERECKTLGFPL